MKLYSFGFAGTVRWNVRPEDPIAWPSFASGFRLLNPLVPVDNEPIRTSQFTLPDGRVHLLANRLHLLADDEEDVEWRDEELAGWLLHLRFAAKQAAFPADVMAVATRDIDADDLSVSLPRPVGKGRLIGKYHVETAVDADVVAAAFEARDNNVALFHELMLDALRAAERRQFREAILYSAMGVEAMSQYELTRHYDAAALAEPSPPHLNFLRLPLAGGGEIKKDPIYERLVRGESFNLLLNEIPLYLIRRSLLGEEPDLYRRAVALYTTRNKLAHGVAPDADRGHLEVDVEGARVAVNTAVDVFEWFGQTGYRVPDAQSIEVGFC